MTTAQQTLELICHHVLYNVMKNSKDANIHDIVVYMFVKERLTTQGNDHPESALLGGGGLITLMHMV